MAEVNIFSSFFSKSYSSSSILNFEILLFLYVRTTATCCNEDGGFTSQNQYMNCARYPLVWTLSRMDTYLHLITKPPEAPLKVCPDFRGFEAPKIALSLSGDRGFEALRGRRLSGFRGFEALGPEIFGISYANRPNLALRTTAVRLCEGFSTP